MRAAAAEEDSELANADATAVKATTRANHVPM